MGYNTFKSIGKPLPNRLNIVVSKNHSDELNSQNILNFPDLNTIFQYLEFKNDIKIFIIGGALLYNDVFTNYSPMIDAIYYTKVITSL